MLGPRGLGHCCIAIKVVVYYRIGSFDNRAYIIDLQFSPASSRSVLQVTIIMGPLEQRLICNGPGRVVPYLRLGS
jgi:hypothetical protein